MKDGQFDAWPVVDERGLRGMVRNRDQEKAAADGVSRMRVSDLLNDGSLLHLHPDHSLSLEFERMGNSGLNVLPVVSRANVRELVGIIALQDVLDAYGVAKQAGPVGQTK